MLAASDKFKSHLRASHSRRVRAGLYVVDGNSYAFAGYLGLAGGNLSIDYSRNIRRQASLQVSSLESLLDYSFVDIAARDYLESLTSGSAEIEIEWGLLYPDGTDEWVTLARLRIEESTLDTVSGSVSISAAYDAGSRVNDFNLVTPYAPYDINGNKLTYLAAIQDLVDTSYPSAAPPTWNVDPAVDSTSYPPDGTAFTGSRWSAVESLAKAINVRVGPNHLGEWDVVPDVEGRDPAWTINSGVDGVLVSETTQFSRREQYNAVGVRWELPGGSGGLAYIVDADPTSPTYYDGPFGRKPRPEETIATITTSQQAIDAATALLNKYKGRTRGISLTAVHCPLLEPNDILAVYLPDGSAERHVIDTVNLPLGEGTMNLETRVLRGGITYNEPGVTYNDPDYTYAGQGV